MTKNITGAVSQNFYDRQIKKNKMDKKYDKKVAKSPENKIRMWLQKIADPKNTSFLEELQQV